VDGYPDEKLTQRQVRALFRFLSRPSRLKDVLIRRARPPEFDSLPAEPEEWLGPDSRKLVKENAGQREAVTMALRTRDILLISGPPGSGKTRLIGALVEGILKRDPQTRVLLVAATNRALDQAMEKIMTPALADVPKVRLGGESVVSERVRPLTPAACAEGVAGAEAKAAAAGAAVRNARVAAVTASTLAGGALDAVLGAFGWVVMDEASQMTVPLGLGAASYGERLILIGDDRQLPPIARAADPERGEWPGLSVSLFALARERLMGRGPVLVELERQYRMSEGVGAAPAAVWYDGRLAPGSRAVADRRLIISSKWEQHPMAAVLDPERPVRVVDIPGGSRPRVHDGEAAWVAEFLAALESCGAAPVAPGEEGGVSVAVISPFRAQVARIRTVLGAAFPDRRARWRLCADTVDRFQGGEADVVVVSLCPPPEMSEHLADPRRLNVAITRARVKVILLGDCGRLERYPVFQRLFAEYEKQWPGGGWRVR
jgi:DNA replication ATP-dependent helicase Dna2